ncbi:MAG: Rpn family recombination-promoting nuclease/putative transposase [Saprospiraceae bacterium]|nr:Rpn family recombination-promoting nuclease/putative transposase [Saprospiraceae bacterium]
MALYDLLFKIFFSDVRIAKQFIRQFLPRSVRQGIDFTFFRRASDSYVSGRFSASFCDALYETRRKNGDPVRVAFLFEHKSAPPRIPIHLQILDYMLQVWEDDIKNGRPYTEIIPIVFYHGEAPWVYREFFENFPYLSKRHRRFVPDFKYLLVNLNAISAEKIESLRKAKYLRSMLLTFKFARDLERLTRHLPVIMSLPQHRARQSGDRLLYNSLIFFLESVFAMKDKNFDSELAYRVPKDAQEAYEMLEREFWRICKPEFLQKAREEGRAEGRAEGREEHAQTVAANLLHEYPDWTDARIASISGLSEKEVRALRERLTNKSNGNGAQKG